MGQKSLGYWNNSYVITDFIFKEVKKLTDNYDFFGVENFKSSKIVEKSKEKNKWYSAKRMYDSSLSSLLKKTVLQSGGNW